MIEEMSHVELKQLFSKMSDNELHVSAVQTAEKERKITLALLRHLNEIERRHLYSKFSVSSLHAYCVKELKMDDGAAGRRISAARLLRELPAVEEKILSGSVSLTNVAQAGIFLRKEARNGNSFSLDEKRNLLFELEDKSTREVDRILMSKSDQPEIHFKERVSLKTETTTEVRLYFDEETMAALNRLKEIWSHAIPHAGFADLIKRAATEAVAKHDPFKKKLKVEKAQRAESLEQEKSSDQFSAESTSAPKSDLTNAEIKRVIWKRDEAQCTFVDPRTGELCASRRFVEEDHIVPNAFGGDYSVDNIRLRCRTHNQRHAIDSFGHAKMREHLHSMRG